MRGGPVIGWRDTCGSPIMVGSSTITPLAWSLVARWPGGGSVWSGPTAVVIERVGRTERVLIGNLSGRILWAIRVGAVALIAARLASDRRRRTSDD